MPGGQKPKRGQPNCNISELQNHPKPSPAPSKHSRHTTPAQSQAPSPDYDDEDDEDDLEEDDADLDLLVHWDSQKTQYVNDPEDKGEGEVVDDDDDEELQEWEGFGKEELLDIMIGMFEHDDEGDLDWLPPKLAAKCKKRQENKKGKHSPEICRFRALKNVKSKAQNICKGARCHVQSTLHSILSCKVIQNTNKAHRVQL